MSIPNRPPLVHCATGTTNQFYLKGFVDCPLILFSIENVYSLLSVCNKIGKNKAYSSWLMIRTMLHFVFLHLRVTPFSESSLLLRSVFRMFIPDIMQNFPKHILVAQLKLRNFFQKPYELVKVEITKATKTPYCYSFHFPPKGWIIKMVYPKRVQFLFPYKLICIPIFPYSPLSIFLT